MFNIIGYYLSVLRIYLKVTKKDYQCFKKYKIRFMNKIHHLLILVLSLFAIDNQKSVYKTDQIPKVDNDTIILNGVLSNSNAFHKAWEDTLKPIIIDAYKLNTINWECMQSDKRVIGVIHKSSEGFRKDSGYDHRKIKAKSLGYKWGAYHLGKPGNPVKQADFYLQCIKYADGDLLALDLEGLDERKFMGLKDAELFIERIYEKTGRYPLIYCNHLVLKSISKKYEKESIFSKCGLWYARFNPTIKNFYNKVWASYSFWQFSSEINCKKTGTCLYNVPGTKYDMDINVYNGTISELKEKWPNI